MLRASAQVLPLAQDQLVVVTGASGWVGRSALHELQRMLPVEEFQHSVVACASKPGIIASTGYSHKHQTSVKLHPLGALPEIVRGKKILLIHTAFLTRDRLAYLGFDSYVATNRWITQTVANALIQASESRVIEISSGAAAEASNQQELQVEQVHDPYGFLKLQEELCLASVAPTQVFRIYALTGRFMRDPSLFALGDFLKCALQGLPIRIRSTSPVVRGYGHAADIARAALLWLTSSNDVGIPIATCSVEISLLELADLTASLFNLPPTEAKINPELTPDVYSAKADSFTKLLAGLGLSALDLTSQIIDTSHGLKFGRDFHALQPCVIMPSAIQALRPHCK